MGLLTVKVKVESETNSTLVGTVASLCRKTHKIAYDEAVKDEPFNYDPTGDPESNTRHHFDIMMEPVTPNDYYLVVEGTTKAATGTYDVDVLFHGVMPANQATLNLKGAGSISEPFDPHTFKLLTSKPGLLRVYTKGSTDTKGELVDTTPDTDESVTDKDSGEGKNFQIFRPLKAQTSVASAYTVYVEGQDRDDRGAFTLGVDFKEIVKTLAYPSASDSTETIGESGDKDYFLIEVQDIATTTGIDESKAFMTVQTSGTTNTNGTLYGPEGEIAKDTSSGAGSNFKIQAPVSTGVHIVEVAGNTTPKGDTYTVSVSSDAALSAPAIPSKTVCNDASDCDIVAATSGNALNVYRFLLDIPTSGTLEVRTEGSTDTVGTLYGPDGRQLATNDDGGTGKNFLISRSVTKGKHLVAVAGQTRDTDGAYDLYVNFLTGTDPIDPGTGDDVASLRARIAQLERDLNACREPVATDSYGSLDNPSDGGYRSGVGLISGWVCAAEDVEVRISNARGVNVRTLDVAYGTSRPDTVGSCRHQSANTGFGMTYNFNHLPEGTYTITAYADDQQIGSERTFTVVHLTSFAATDTDRFLRLDDEVKARGECRVDDFPAAGEDTFLKWEESTQNFVIEDAG